MSDNSLDLQTRKINDYRQLKAPRTKQLAGFTIHVLPGVYPGGADSEILCQKMVIPKGSAVLDLCTGTGVIAITASLRGAGKVTGTDLNPAAIDNANLNKREQRLNNIEFIETDLFPPVDQYDVISINPPYTDRAAPDKTAICFWDKDHYVVRTFFKKLSRYLKPNGKAYMTWSDFAEQDLLPKLASASGFSLKLIGSQDGLSGFTYFVFEVSRK